MGLRLLIVDDNQMQIDTLFTFLNFEEYGISDIQTAANGVMCLEIASWFHPHIIITDIEMPKMDGHNLCKRIKTNEKMKNIPVYLFSSLINEQMRLKGESVGADAQFSKPQINELIDYLRKHI